MAAELPGDDPQWERFRHEWTLPEDVVYLNHGSFGPSPRLVQEARANWQRQLESEPVDFFLRRMEPLLEEATEELARLFNAPADSLVFVDNATAGMNIVAASVELQSGDEVLLTDHEYGAVRRIWQKACERVGARVRVQPLPSPLQDEDEVVDTLLAAVNPRTKLLVVSHITSPTAVILPVEKICQRAREWKLSVCIDGPHAVGIAPLDLQRLDCDYYTASCHKWLSAPFGSGFLYAHRRVQRSTCPAVVSWGGSVGGRAPTWRDEFNWIGTRDPSAFLAVPDAIRFLADVGWERFRNRAHSLARFARERLSAVTGFEPLVPDDPLWYGSMIAVPLPLQDAEPPASGRRDPLQDALWEQARIEVPVVWWQRQRLIRVSCHLYTQRAEIELLAETLARLLA